MPPQPQSRGGSRASATLVSTGLFLAGVDQGASTCFISVLLALLEALQLLVPSECEESVSSGKRPPQTNKGSPQTSHVLTHRSGAPARSAASLQQHNTGVISPDNHLRIS